MDTNAALWE